MTRDKKVEEIHQGLDQHDQDHDQLLAPLLQQQFCAIESTQLRARSELSIRS